MKYHEEHMKVSMVSVSRRAAAPHCGQVVRQNASERASGESPVGRNSTSYGSSTGSCSSGTGTMPQWSQ